MLDELLNRLCISLQSYSVHCETIETTVNQITYFKKKAGWTAKRPYETAVNDRSEDGWYFLPNIDNRNHLVYALTNDQPKGASMEEESKTF